VGRDDIPVACVRELVGTMGLFDLKCSGGSVHFAQTQWTQLWSPSDLYNVLALFGGFLI
jgi:hypothetical protein